MTGRIFALLVALALLLPACAQQATSPTPRPTTAAASAPATAAPGGQSGGSVTLPGSGGQSVTISSQVPDALKGFPVPTGFTPTSEGTGSITTSTGSMAVANWTGSGNPQSVIDFYTKALPTQGWKQDFVMTTDTGSELSYSKGDQQVMLTIDTSESITKIAVMLGKSTATPTAAPVAAPAATAAPTRAPTAAAPEPTETAAPPKLTDASALPDELKSLPVPPGFQVVSGSTMRIAQNGQLSVAGAQWFGPTSPKDLETFYKKALAAGWTEDELVEAEGGFTGVYTSIGQPALQLGLNAQTGDAGTTVEVSITPKS